MFFWRCVRVDAEGREERVGEGVEGLRGIELDRQYGVRVCLFGLRKGLWGFWSVEGWDVGRWRGVFGRPHTL